MNRDIIILAKSRKHNNYCVAGKDIKTGEWIRLVSDDRTIHNAIKGSDLVYNNNEEANVLDVVRVVVKNINEDNKIFYQPENYILDDNYYLLHLEKKNSEYLDKIMDNDDLIFFNDSNCVSNIELHNVREINSLILVEPEIVKVKKKNYNTLWANIRYNNIWYNNLTITDTSFTSKFYENISNDYNGTNFYDFKLVISLGEEFNGYHYKLIASIIEPDNILAFNEMDF